jgi:hypothetical protein
MKNTLVRSVLVSLALLAAAPLSRAFYIFQTLSVRPDYDYPTVYQMNENSTIVGTLGGWGVIAARWSSTGTLTSIPSIGPAHSAWGFGINNAGLIVGFLDQTGGPLHAFYNAPGVGSAVLPTPAPAGVTTELRVINDAGYAVGVYSSSGTQTAFYTHPLGYKANISAVKVGASFYPVAINNSGDVLGNSSFKGVVYNLLDATAVKVTDRVPTMVSAAAMNELGDVAGVDAGSKAYILPKDPASPVIVLGVGLVKTVHGMNDARELLITTMTNRPAILRPSASIPDGVIQYLDTLVPSPWTVFKLADINNAGNICGVARRPSVPADATTASHVYRPFKLTELTFVPVLP